jgi:pimeloyl-ACP methyl ester carboxylesterase
MTTTTAPVTQTVTSADGTKIAYEKAGSGPALLVVDGAMCYRSFGPAAALAKQLQDRFTVYTYDRRGRGESGDTKPYSVHREIEDIAALIGAAGGSVNVFAMSSGAALSLEAASKLDGIEKLAIYEAPFIVDDTHPPRVGFQETLDEHIAKNDRSGALKFFMKTVGAPSIMVAVMSLTPPWKKLKAVAHTLPYDARVVGDRGLGHPLPPNAWPGATMPVLAFIGGKSPKVMHNAQQAIVDQLPDASLVELPGQTHMVKAPVVAPHLSQFYGVV